MAVPLLKCDKPGKVLQVVKTLPEPMRDAGRIRLLVGQALLEAGKLNELEPADPAGQSVIFRLAVQGPLGVRIVFGRFRVCVGIFC